jgi:hypothetical protein
MPPSLKVRLKYVQLVVFVANAGANTSVYSFRANSPFAPDLTATSGISHQPLGWDQWTTFYGHYAVPHSTIKIGCNAIGTTFTGMGNIFIVRSDINGAVSTLSNTLFEDPKCRRKLIGLSGSPSVSVSNDFSASRDIMPELDDRIIAVDSRYSADITTNPTDQWYWHTGFASDSSLTVAQSATVEIIYDVLFTSRRDLATS